jgi:hypothetical protein
MPRPRIGSGVLLLAAAWVVGACGGDSGGTGNSQLPPPAGTYDLVSIAFPPQPAVGPPAFTGTLTLTGAAYTVLITQVLPGPPATVVADTGTFTASGGNWSQNSSTGLPQSVGTYTFSKDTLDVSVTTPVATTTVWAKQ